MLAVKGIYDGISIKPKEKIPFNESYDVIITFVKPNARRKTAKGIRVIRPNPATGHTVLPADMYYDGDDVYEKLLNG